MMTISLSHRDYGTSSSREIRLATLVQVHQSLDDAAQKRPLLGLGLVRSQRLHDRDATAPAREQDRPACP